MLPNSSLSNRSPVTTVRVLDLTVMDVTTLKCSVPSSWTMPRKRPFTKLGAVRSASFDSLHNGNGLPSYHAQTRRRAHAGSRFFNPASESELGVSPRSRRAASSLLTAALADSRLLSWD